MLARQKKAEVDRWVADLGIENLSGPWALSFTLSTVPMKNWLYHRNQLKPDSIKLELIVPEGGLWRVQLDRHDGLFQAQWRPGDDLRIESRQLKYSRLVPWPQLNALNEFPRLASAVEACLGIRFIRHVDIWANGADSETLIAHPGIKDWLSDCADSVGRLRQ